MASHIYTKLDKGGLALVALFKKIQEFFGKKDIVISFRRYAIEAMGAMALGLFSSLIVGSIMREIGNRANIEILHTIGTYAFNAAGYAMGVAIAFGLKAPPLVLFSSAAVGFAGNYLDGPVTVLVAVIIGAEAGKLVSKETKVDIIVTPMVTLFVGICAAMLVSMPIGWAMGHVSGFIAWATELMPVLMGAVVAVVMGMLLTAPISSAAIAIALELDGIAAGAAVAGCAANMIGFAVSSYRENKVGGLVSQGIGTSMLQMPNIMKNPRIWIPPIVASIFAGILSAAVFGMTNNRFGAGMGTSGLVGQFNAFSSMVDYVPLPALFAQIGIVHFVVPAVISIIISELMRKKGWIKFGDMKLS